MLELGDLDTDLETLWLIIMGLDGSISNLGRGFDFSLNGGSSNGIRGGIFVLTSCTGFAAGVSVARNHGGSDNLLSEFEILSS